MNQPLRNLSARRFWNWTKDEDTGARTLYLDGVIAEGIAGPGREWICNAVTGRQDKAMAHNH